MDRPALNRLMEDVDGADGDVARPLPCAIPQHAQAVERSEACGLAVNPIAEKPCRRSPVLKCSRPRQVA